jgi:outer membrane protein assembly factor BamB
MSKILLNSLILLLTGFFYPQIRYTALITEPQIGIQENANNLIQAVDDINKRKNISRVIVLGNITVNGKYDEFIWAQEILLGLRVPYFVLGGERDYFLSRGRGSEITLLWGDDKKIFYGKNYNLLCLNTIMPEYSTDYHLTSETLEWLNDALSKSNRKRIITFSYFPINKANNSNKFFEMTLGYKLFSFVSKEEKQKSEIPAFEGLYLNRKNDWGYLLISNKKDSLNIIKVLGSEVNKKTKPEIIAPVFAPITTFEPIKPFETFSSVDVIWSVNFDKTIITSPVIKNDKIFAGFKDGTTVCFFSTGKENWKYDSHGKIKISPITSEDLFITANANGDINILNVNTGPSAQVIGIGESITGIAAVNIGDSLKGIVAGTINGNLYCYNLETLEPVWTQQDTNTTIKSPVVYYDNKIFFQDSEGTLYCLSSENGLLIWKIPPDQGGWKNQTIDSWNHLKTDIVANDNNIFLTDNSGNLFCVDALLGTLQWNIKNIYANGLIRLDNKNNLIIPTGKNKILIVSGKSSKILNEIKLPADRKEHDVTDLCMIGNNLLISFDDGWVYIKKQNQKPEKIFRGGSASIVSLTNVYSACLVTDYDGNFNLLKIPSGK